MASVAFGSPDGGPHGPGQLLAHRPIGGPSPIFSAGPAFGPSPVFASGPIVGPGPVAGPFGPGPIVGPIGPGPVVSPGPVFGPGPIISPLPIGPVFGAPHPVPAPLFRPGPGPAYGVPEIEGPAVYDFSYGVQDPLTGTNFGHSEARDGYATQGTYYVNLPDGRLQVTRNNKSLNLSCETSS